MAWMLLPPPDIATLLFDVSPCIREPVVQLTQVHPRQAAQHVLLRLSGVRTAGMVVNPGDQDARITTDFLLARK